MISCSEAVRRLWEYLDQELEDDDRRRVDEHLVLCRRCCGEAEFAAELQTLLRSASAPPLTGEVEDHLMTFLSGLAEDQLEGDPP